MILYSDIQNDLFDGMCNGTAETHRLYEALVLDNIFVQILPCDQQLFR
jgi:hypothetical protein